MFQEGPRPLAPNLRVHLGQRGRGLGNPQQVEQIRSARVYGETEPTVCGKIGTILLLQIVSTCWLSESSNPDPAVTIDYGPGRAAGIRIRRQQYGAIEAGSRVATVAAVVGCYTSTVSRALQRC